MIFDNACSYSDLCKIFNLKHDYVLHINIMYVINQITYIKKEFYSNVFMRHCRTVHIYLQLIVRRRFI